MLKYNSNKIIDKKSNSFFVPPSYSTVSLHLIVLQACKQRKRVPKGITNDLEDIITTVIQVFVDSYPYIPEHRRHLLFNKLITVIGEKQYLWRLMLLLMKHVVTKGTLKAELTSETQEVSIYV